MTEGGGGFGHHEKAERGHTLKYNFPQLGEENENDGAMKTFKRAKGKGL